MDIWLLMSQTIETMKYMWIYVTESKYWDYICTGGYMTDSKYWDYVQVDICDWVKILRLCTGGYIRLSQNTETMYRWIWIRLEWLELAYNICRPITHGDMYRSSIPSPKSCLLIIIHIDCSYLAGKEGPKQRVKCPNAKIRDAKRHNS